MSQEDMILEYMETHRGITQAEAVEALGCYRLAARIADIRDRGVSVERVMEEGKNRFGAPIRYARYFIKR